jgi:hypothetical protein
MNNKISYSGITNLITNDQIKINSIMSMQSLPEEVIVNLLRFRGKLIKDKKGKLRIVQK